MKGIERTLAIKRVAIDVETYNRLIGKAHYGQSLGGVVKELLDLSDRIEGKPPVSSNQPKANETIEFKNGDKIVGAYKLSKPVIIPISPPIVAEDKTKAPEIKSDTPPYAD
jgi:hypothetical protein